MFKKNKDYYLTSMLCYILLTYEIEKLKEFSDKKIAYLSEEILRDGVEIFENDFEVSYGNVKIDLIKDKSKQLQAVEVVEFFDYNLKWKKFVLAYSLLNEIKKFKMTFKKDNTVRGDIGTYIVRMFARNGKEYLEKEIFLNKKNVEYSMITANNVKSTIFFEYRNWIIPISLNVTARYFDSLVKKEKEQGYTRLKNGYTMLSFREATRLNSMDKGQGTKPNLTIALHFHSTSPTKL